MLLFSLVNLNHTTYSDNREKLRRAVGLFKGLMSRVCEYFIVDVEVLPARHTPKLQRALNSLLAMLPPLSLSHCAKYGCIKEEDWILNVKMTSIHSHAHAV